MTPYTFPFNSCEKPNHENLILQPYSAFINGISCFIIFYFLCQTKTIYSFCLLGSLFLFELVHTLSHSFHLSGMLQTYMIHFLAYCANGALLLMLYNTTKKVPDVQFTLFLMLFVSLDIYSLLNLSIIYYFCCQSVLLLGILFYYYPLLSASVQRAIHWITVLAFVIVLLLQNEINNCQYMRSKNPDIPYHVLIEMVGLALFYLICRTFYKL